MFRTIIRQTTTPTKMTRSHTPVRRMTRMKSFISQIYGRDVPNSTREGNVTPVKEEGDETTPLPPPKSRNAITMTYWSCYTPC